MRGFKWHLAIIGFVSLLVPDSVGAEGMIYLLAEETPWDISTDAVAFTPFNVYVAYCSQWVGGGPAGIHAMEFMIEFTEPSKFIILGEQWRPEVNITFGGLTSGISLATSHCLMVDGDHHIYMGSFSVLTFQNYTSGTAPAQIRVVPDPGALEQGIWVAACDENMTLFKVSGLFFCLPKNADACNPAVETSSWGAIKSIYR
jgi:hypothetical protein